MLKESFDILEDAPVPELTSLVKLLIRVRVLLRRASWRQYESEMPRFRETSGLDIIPTDIFFPKEMDPPLIPDGCYSGFIQAARYPTKQARAKVLLPAYICLAYSSARPLQLDAHS